ncbi:MAG: GtrA family protein [Clostridia bacterium]
MIDFIKRMFIKYKEIITYAFFGVLTTAVNYGVYVLLTRVFQISETTVLPNGIAFVVSVIFAYFTNRKWVFNSQVSGVAGVAKEFATFFAARILAGLLDLGFVYVAVDLLKGNDLIWKLVSNIIIIIVNFVISKLLVFRKKNVENNDGDKIEK